MCNFWREYRRAINPLPQLRWHCARCGELAGPNATEWVKWHVCRKEERMSTTFKAGLREAMAKACNGRYILAGEIQEGIVNGIVGKVAQAALAYCDQWEEVEVCFYPGEHNANGIVTRDGWYRRSDGEERGRTTILIRRDPPKPTRGERLNKAIDRLSTVTGALAKAPSELLTVSQELADAIAEVRRAAKEDR